MLWTEMDNQMLLLRICNYSTLAIYHILKYLGGSGIRQFFGNVFESFVFVFILVVLRVTTGILILCNMLLLS